MNEPLRQVALRKDGQTYIFRFDAASYAALLGVLKRLAVDPAFNFSWHDVAVVCKQARQPRAEGNPSVLPPAVKRFQ